VSTKPGQLHNRLFLGLFGLAVNSEFHYPKYFSMLPAGPDPKHAFSAPFFVVAMGGDPKPKTLALLAEDAEFPKNASEGVRDIANQNAITIVYDKTYPPGTPDFTPIVHAIQGTNPDMAFVASDRHAARRHRKRPEDAVFRREHGSSYNTPR
jgi:branched-chain amino acid transport system substrate-binding protein